MHTPELRQDLSVRCYSTNHAIFSTPVIDAKENIYVGSANCYFYAINPINDTISWKFETTGVIDSAACLDTDQNIYIPSGDASLYKLSNTGKREWVFDLLQQNYSRFSTIYWWEGNVAIGPNEFVYAGNDDFYLYALTPDGHVQWRFPTGLQIWSVPAFNNGLVYFTSFDMCVYALDQDTGRLKWKRRLDNFIASSPAIGEDGTVYVSTFGGSIFSLDGQTGKVVWQTKTAGSMYASPAIAPDGSVFIGSGDYSVYCLEAATGVVRWTLPVDSAVWSSMAIGSDPEKQEQYLVYVGTSGGLVMALAPNGRVRWTYRVCTQKDTQIPVINASIALGKSGLVVATIAGDVIYIPYDAYTRDIERFSLGDDSPKEKVLPTDRKSVV